MGTDGTARYQVGTLSKVFTNENVGFERFTFNPNPQPGWLPMFGGAYSRTTYADLWAWVQTQDGYCISESEWQDKFAANNGNVPFYSSGDGSSTFRVPSVSCWVKGASGISEVGSYLEAGLPNITGNIEPMTFASTSPVVNGAFSKNSQDSSGSAQSNTTRLSVSFAASRSSAIYGKSTTVQPQSIVGMWMVKAYGTVTNSGNIDIATLEKDISDIKEEYFPLKGNRRITGAIILNAGRINSTNDSNFKETWISADESYNDSAILTVTSKNAPNMNGEWVIKTADSSTIFLSSPTSGELVYENYTSLNATLALTNIKDKMTINSFSSDIGQHHFEVFSRTKGNGIYYPFENFAADSGFREIIVSEYNDGWCWRFSNGLQILMQFMTSSGGWQTQTLYVPFNGTNFAVYTQDGGVGLKVISASAASSTTINTYCNGEAGFNALMIGRWK